MTRTDHALRRMTRQTGSIAASASRLALAAAVAVSAAVAGAADWYVLCERETGEVVVGQSSVGTRYQVLAGPFPGRRTAGMWIEDNHPDRRCDAAGAVQDGGAASSATGDWLAVCSQASQQVELVQGAPPTGYLVLLGDTFGARVHPDEVTARAWTGTVCPSWRCDEMGRCVAGPAHPGPGATGDGWTAGKLVSVTPGSGTAGGGWQAGELTSVTQGAGVAAPSRTGAGVAVAGPQSVAGPGSADLGPLIETATAAANACAYPAALTSADHMANFDPSHPWLVANHDTLRRLAARQRETEQSVWQASSALQAGELKQARRLAGLAADSAVSCQTQAVSQLLQGIDTAIEQHKAERRAANRQAAAALLPGLIDLAGVISGQQGGTTIPTFGGTTSSAAATVSTVGDPCAFKYEYRNVWNTMPFCTCVGYVFDPRQFRCVRQ